MSDHKQTAAKVDLHDAHAIRRELAQLYREARGGSVPVAQATKLAYILELLRKAYDSSVLQERVDNLERVTGHQGGR